MAHTKFFGSQVGGSSVINYSYTDMPWKLMMWDVRYFFKFAWYLPWIVWPVTPCDGGDFDELSLTAPNLWCIFVHIILVFLQLTFLLALPLAFVLPVWLFLAALAAFLLVNSLLCRCLNGGTITYTSDPRYAPALREHQHEQWIFVNGVAVGEAWLMSNINRLALTFKRPVIGVHNRTSGIIFDVIECLIQRNFGLATSDIRQAYKIIKEKLYNPQYSKVVFILHSQGGIEGGLVLDWLLQELPQDLLAKLEVYTFGNAANHFNNPHRSAATQDEERTHPDTAFQKSNDLAQGPITDSPVELKTPIDKRVSAIGGSSATSKVDPTDNPKALSSVPNGQSTTYKTTTVPASERVIGYVEHYAHTTDFVALWGVLHFVTNERASPLMPRFIGRVFSRDSPRGGHQFCQHYLDGMFPLKKDAKGEFTGCADSNEFMESVVELAPKGNEHEVIREGFERSLGLLELDGGQAGGSKNEVAVHGSFHEDKDEVQDGQVRVKDLSRLWLYRNGQSPSEIPRWLRRDEDGVVRGATM
ncbi:hypothetical protein F5Y15DRAFT_407783 [Xylariaceae sp. FL0016]|nr:hypothetical protein F5Y15DRAFT_407783 [Xylariaceae sp. FL0016]